MQESVLSDVCLGTREPTCGTLLQMQVLYGGGLLHSGAFTNLFLNIYVLTNVTHASVYSTEDRNQDQECFVANFLLVYTTRTFACAFNTSDKKAKDLLRGASPDDAWVSCGAGNSVYSTILGMVRAISGGGYNAKCHSCKL